MIKLENTIVSGWEAAIRGMRNPLNSWAKSDSAVIDGHDFFVGDNDLKLMRKLSAAGSDHRKFMRFITVTVDITAPLYWWKEFDTYKVGTVANSCSTMHKIAAKPFEIDDFSHEHLVSESVDWLNETISYLNDAREIFNEWKDTKPNDVTAELETKKDAWWQMIQLLPSSYNQRRTVMLNYEVLRNIYHARKAHKLDEWHTFCDWIEALPHSELITGEVKNES